MNNKAVIGAAVACGIVAAIVSAARRPREPQPNMWEKMGDHMRDMPDDFPPRIMFDNMQAIRANTDRIVEVLERHQGGDERVVHDLTNPGASV